MRGMMYLEYMPGETLESVWPTLDADAKERICRDTWALLEKLRREVPKPKTADGDGDGENGQTGAPLFYCAADGTPNIIQPLLGDEYHPPPSVDG